MAELALQKSNDIARSFHAEEDRRDTSTHSRSENSEDERQETNSSINRGIKRTRTTTPPPKKMVDLAHLRNSDSEPDEYDDEEEEEDSTPRKPRDAPAHGKEFIDNNDYTAAEQTVPKKPSNYGGPRAANATENKRRKVRPTEPASSVKLLDLKDVAMREKLKTEVDRLVHDDALCKKFFTFMSKQK